MLAMALPVYSECQGSYSEFGTEITVNIDGEGFTFRAKGRTKKVSKANVAQEAHKAYLLEPPAQPVSQVGPHGDQTWVMVKPGTELMPCEVVAAIAHDDST